jgi:hypothetical protein
MTLRSIQKLPVTGLEDPNQRRRQVEVLNQITEPPIWIAPTLVNSWVNFGTSFAEAGYYIDALTRVHFRGLVKDGTVTPGTVLFTLPAGYRPLDSLLFTTFTFDGAATQTACRVDVHSDGTVTAGAGVESGYLSLNGISFLAEQ